MLRNAAGEWRLTFEELADRIEAALGARTRGELACLTRDLPPAPERAVVPAGADLEMPRHRLHGLRRLAPLGRVAGGGAAT